MPNVIYGLIDPNTNELRYIGYTSHPTERLRNHCKERGKSHKIHWIQSLIKRGQKPEMYIIDEYATAEELPDAEIGMIAYCKYIGCNLTNGTDGGDGGNYWKGKQKTQAMKDKHSAAMKGRKLSTEHKQALSLAAKNVIHQSLSTDHKRAISDSMKEIKLPFQILSQTDVDTIRAEYKRGNGVALAKRFGVSPVTVSAIVNNRIWKQ